MNNEDIEIVYLSDDDIQDKNNKKKKSFDFKKYKTPIMIGVPSVILLCIVIFVCVFLFNRKEVVLLNVIGEKQKIDTTLDLKGIFESDNNQFDTFEINNLSKAVISNNKIYYSYSPNYCVYEDDETPDGLCASYYENGTDYNDLVTRYVMVSDLDGSNVNELAEHVSTAPIEFRYFDNDLALYYSNNDETSYKLDFSNNIVTKIKENYQVVSFPLSNDKETILATYKEDFYTLYYYNYNDYNRPTKQVNLYYGKDTLNNDIRIDSYNKEDFYTISSSKYDSSLSADYNGVYKNSKLFYQFRNDYEEFFVGQKFLYILTTTGYNVRLLKVDKETGEEHTPVIILRSNKKINNIDYITTGNDNLVYINIDNSVYTFNQVDDSLLKTDLSYYLIDSTGSFKNYIYFYVKSREANDFYDLVLYNTVTKEDKVISNVEYFTINNNNLYTVENVEDLLELYKYPVF